MELEKELLEGLCKNSISLAKKIRTQNKISGRNSSAEAYSLIITILKILHPGICETKIGECITDGLRDANIDAVFIPNAKDQNIEIFGVSSEPFDYNDILLFKNNVTTYIFGRGKLKDLNRFLKEKIQKVRKKIKRGQKIDFYICWKDLKAASAEKKLKELSDELKDFGSVKEVYFLNGKELSRKFVEKEVTTKHYKWPLNVLDEEPLIERQTGKIKSMTGRVSVKKIIKLMKNYKTQNMNLFEKNVREFQGKKELSGGILRTLNERPKDFYIFHNGITFVCNEIVKRTKTDFDIINPQVINGCQTVNTLYNSSKKKFIKKESLNNASILCRFYVLSTPDIEKVCQSTNTQIKITPSDLRSNDKIQKILEKLFELKNKIYKRKRSRKKTGCIILPQIAQWIYSCKFENPAEAKDKKSLLFDVISNNGLYHKIFDENTLDWEEVFKIMEIGEFVEKKIKEIRKAKKVDFEKYADLHIIAGIYFLEKDKKLKDRAERYDKTVKIMSRVIKKIRKKYGKDYSYNKMFTKTPETWSLIKEKIKKCKNEF